jgi:calcium/calmodulin-dependent protein kinase (CaM kinase) II/calcium/calmodulin-dependent protein kinase I
MVAATSTPSSKPGATLIPGDRTADLFDNDYVLQDRLRSGSYGVVWTTAHKTTHDVFAVKVIDRTKLKQKDDDGVYREVKILKDLMEVENIVKLMDFYEDPKTFYVVQFYAKGGDVFDRLAKRTSYTEADARNFAEVLLQTMKALHDLKLCHRDMKPENLLLRDVMDDTSILVADFGFAAYVPEDGLKTRCGTPAFVAPEVLIGHRYTQQVDMWSVGCLLFMLIGGYPPFQAESHKGLFRKIRAADFTFHECYWKNVSVHAKQVISKLLTVDPAFRLNAQQAQSTAWLEVKKENLSSRDLSTSLTELQKFNATRTLKSAMHAVLWSVQTAFRHEKVSDLSIATDAWDDDQKTPPKNGDTARQTEAFNLSSARGHKSRFEDVYEFGRKIHSGSFAVVKECLHKKWNQKYAVKIIKRTGTKSLSDEAVLHEVAIMNHLDHPHIVNVVDFFEEPDYYFIVMELMAGGDLFDRIVDMIQYTEKDARDLAKILLEAVDYMHSSGVAHRDLKPQNLLLQVRCVELRRVGKRFSRRMNRVWYFENAGILLLTPFHSHSTRMIMLLSRLGISVSLVVYTLQRLSLHGVER